MHTDLIPNSSILYKVGTDGKKHESGRRLVRVDSIQASVFSSFNRFDHGPLYKGWGQFAWNGNEKGEPIKIDEIYRSNTKQESYTTVSAMDLNGDSYPDWIRENNGKIRVPLTHQIGTLGDGQDYGVEPSMSYGESENTGGDAGLSMDPNSYKLPNFNEQLKKATASFAKSVASLQQTKRLDKNAEGASFSGNVSEGACSASGNFSSGTSESVRA